MRVLLCNRDHASHIGGDAIQVEGYMNALKKLGHHAEYNQGRLNIKHLVDTFDYDEVWFTHINFGWTKIQHRSLNGKLPYRVFLIYYPGIYSDTTHEEMYDILKNAKSVYALSHKEKEEFLEEFPDINVLVIDNGVDKNIFNHEGFVRGVERVLTVGRYSDEKGHLRVIDSCIRLGFPVTVAGSPADIDYRNRCRKKQVEHPDLVECLDNLSQNELANYYRGSRVYVCASRGERNNLTVLEAAACGTTVIDTIHNRAWDMHRFYSVNPLDNDELDEMIMYAWNNPVNLSDDVLSWEEVVKMILNGYDVSRFGA